MKKENDESHLFDDIGNPKIIVTMDGEELPATLFDYCSRTSYGAMVHFVVSEFKSLKRGAATKFRDDGMLELIVPSAHPGMVETLKFKPVFLPPSHTSDYMQTTDGRTAIFEEKKIFKALITLPNKRMIEVSTHEWDMLGTATLASKLQSRVSPKHQDSGQRQVRSRKSPE